MAAPTLRCEDWRKQLARLAPGWDGEGGKIISIQAMETVGNFATVPCSDGGIQLEIHQDGWDLEIEIAPTGKIKSILACYEEK
jgi:hypothetical protein